MEADLQGTHRSHRRRAPLTWQALQLLEFLIKNGSERVIDDARSHVSLLKMLRQFHFIDQNGKDQGINVRNRAKELAELLGDVERIRTERKKARANRNKFGGVEGGMGMGGGFSGSGGGSRYGGFGSDQAEYGGHTGGVYGDGGGFGGQDPSFNETQQRRDRFDEYDEYDEGETVASPPRRKEPASSSARRETKKAEPPKPKAPEPVPDLLAWDDEPAPVASSSGKQPAAAAGNDFGDDDDFDDFQSAAPAPAAKPAGFGIAPPASTSTISSSTQFAAPQPQSAAQNSNLNDLFATVSPAPSANRMVSPPAPGSSMSASFAASETHRVPGGRAQLLHFGSSASGAVERVDARVCHVTRGHGQGWRWGEQEGGRRCVCVVAFWHKQQEGADGDAEGDDGGSCEAEDQSGTVGCACFGVQHAGGGVAAVGVEGCGRGSGRPAWVRA